LNAYTVGKWAMMGGELACSCKQEMMVTSWEGVGDGDTGYHKHCHAAMSCFEHRVVSYPSFSIRQQQKHGMMIMTLFHCKLVLSALT
jgi:hypothetical protein